MTPTHTRQQTRTPSSRHVWVLVDHRTASSCRRPRRRTRLRRLPGPTGVERCPRVRLGISLEHRGPALLPDAVLQSNEASRLLTWRRSRVQRPPATTPVPMGGDSRHRGVHPSDRRRCGRRRLHLRPGAVRPPRGVPRPRFLLGGEMGRRVAVRDVPRTRQQTATAPGVRVLDLGMVAGGVVADERAEIGVEAIRSGIGEARPTAVAFHGGATIRRRGAPSTERTFGRQNRTIQIPRAVAAVRDDEGFRYVAVHG